MGKDKDENQEEGYRPVHFGGKTAGEHWDERWSEAAYDRFKHERGRAPGARAGDADGGYAAEQWEQKMRNEWNNNQARSAATGGWAAGLNEHAKTLYEEDGLSYQDMRKYAQGAGIIDINSENDVKGIREYMDSIYTSQDELDEAIGGLNPEEEAETDPNKQDKPIAYSDEVQQALERTKNFGSNPNTTSIYKESFRASQADPPQDGAEEAERETSNFLDKYKMNLRGSLKPSTAKNNAVARDVVEADLA